jgi:uncharacterized membrane protein YqjE
MPDPIKSSAMTAQQPGLLTGVVSVGRNLLGLLFNRVELAAYELAEARTQLFKLVLVAALGVMALFFALTYWTVLIVLLNWDALGWRILVIMVAAFTLLTLGLMLYVRSMLHTAQLAMQASLSELCKDRDALLASGES